MEEDPQNKARLTKEPARSHTTRHLHEVTRGCPCITCLGYQRLYIAAGGKKRQFKVLLLLFLTNTG